MYTKNERATRFQDRAFHYLINFFNPLVSLIYYFA